MEKGEAEVAVTSGDDASEIGAESTTGDTDEIRLNPLMLDEILLNVLKRLDFKGLKTCRLVCSRWKYFATPYFKKAANVNFPEGSNEKERTEFCQIVQQTPRRAYTKFTMDCRQWNMFDIGLVLKQCMRTLKLRSPLSSEHNRNFDTEMAVPAEQLYILLKELVNLEELMICFKYYPVRGLESYGDMKRLNLKRICIQFVPMQGTTLLFWIPILRAAHKLQDVEIVPIPDSMQLLGIAFNFLDPFRPDNWEEFQFLESLLASNRISHLRSLRLDSYRDFGVLARSTAESQLRRFAVQKMKFGLKSHNFREFLRKQSDSLEYLEFKVPAGELNQMPQFPVMKSLRVLHINNGSDQRGDRDNGFDLTPDAKYWAYGHQFPVLEVLRLRGAALDFDCRHVFPHVNLDDDDSERYVSHTVNELEVPEWLHPSVIPRIGVLFDRVTRLNIPMQSEQALRMIWQNFTLVEDLRICIRGDICACCICQYEPLGAEDHCLDSVFTGIPFESWFDDDFRATGISSSNASSFKKWISQTSICNLKKLRRLIITDPNKHSTALRRVDKITDMSGYLAFANLNDLIYFSICGELNSITPKCIDYVCEKVDLINESEASELGGIRLVRANYGYEGLQEAPKFFRP